VPKRLLRLAVWRNQARRVARESWRASGLPYLLSHQTGAAPVQSYSIMLRLTQKPAAQLAKLGVADTSVGAGKVKALLRLDCDAVLALLEKRLAP
jgi:hypothetical protein